MRPASKLTPKMVVAIVEQARIEAAEEAAMGIPPPLAAAVLLVGLIGIGWMVRTSWAKEPQEAATPVVASPSPLPQFSKEQVPEKTSTAPADPPIPLPAAPVPSNLEAPSIETKSEPAGSHDAPIAVEADDPEKTVQAFVDQNRKTAEGQLKSLKGEAERLRARLQKVEAGIRRWESLVAALEKSEAAARDLPPTNLEEVPSARPQFRPKADASTLNGPTIRSEPADSPPPANDRPAPSPPKPPR